MKTKASPRAPRRVADHSEAPVIDLVPSYLRLKRILVPVDFSAHSVKALRYAVRFAEQFGAALVLVHVAEPVRYPESIIIPPAMEEANHELVKRTRAALAKFAAKQVPPRLACKNLVRLGAAYEEIAAAAREMDADLIVIATHGHTGLKHLVLGSTAERVVRHAPCPVLTVREREREFA
jgi:universal stress protein A